MRLFICCLCLTILGLTPLFDDRFGTSEGSAAFVAQQANLPRFRDATKEYGPIGGGPPAFADLDGDGFPDLVCDGRIYKNESGKRLFDVTKDSGVSGSGTATIADIDNDGLLDIYFSGGKGKLYRNLGGPRFEDWTDKVPPNKHERSVAAAFGDLDGDGFVDLYVSNYEDWKDNTYPYPDLLFRNRGGKGFEEWWEAKGDQVMAGRGVTFFDTDEDGKPEIYVSNYRLAPNFLWFLDPKLVVKDRAMELGAAGKPGQKVRYGNGTTVPCCGHTIGSCVADFDNDTSRHPGSELLPSTRVAEPQPVPEKHGRSKVPLRRQERLCEAPLAGELRRRGRWRC